jgi:hypothetical protein
MVMVAGGYLSLKMIKHLREELLPVLCIANCRQITYNNLESLLTRTDDQNNAVPMVWTHEENSYN